MIAIEQWSFRFIIFILFAKGNSATHGNIHSKEREVKEDAEESIFRLILNNDFYTTSRSLVSESDDYEQKETITVVSKAVTKETSTVASKAVSRDSSTDVSNATSSVKRSLESESDTYDNEKTTVALKATNVNRSLETESDNKYNEKENSTVPASPTTHGNGPTAVSTGKGSSATESDEFSVHKHTTVAPTAVTKGDGSLRAASESQERKKDAEDEYDTEEHIDGRRVPEYQYAYLHDKHVIYVTTAAWTQRTFPATRERPVTKAWSALMIDDYFLPYMGASKYSLSGDWVYYQKSVDKYKMLPVVGSTFYYFPNWRTDGIPDTLQRYCTQFYKRYGPICAYRMSQGGPHSWQYQYRSFDNWCQMEEVNTGVYWFDPFSILHRGKCNEPADIFPERWSSQDGYWYSQSMNEIMDKAKVADDLVLKINGG